MAFIDKNSVAYQQFGKWQKWLSRFSQNAWIKLLYALIFLALCVENIAIIFNLNFISFNKYILPFEIVYLSFIQYGWLYSWYTIVNNKKHCPKSNYTKQVIYWQIFTIVTLLISIFILFKANNTVGTLAIDLAFLLSWSYYETIICSLHMTTYKSFLINIYYYPIIILATPIIGLFYIATQNIDKFSLWTFLLLFFIVLILYLIEIRYSNCDNSSISTINWNDVKRYNNAPQNKMQTLSCHLHLILNGGEAHEMYFITITIFGISSILGYFEQLLSHKELQSMFTNLWTNLLKLIQHIILPSLGIISIIAIITSIITIIICIIIIFYAYLFRQNR